MTEKNDLGTPTEQLLREALAARANAISPHDLRPAQPPSGRLRRLRPVRLVLGIAMFGLAASVAGYLTFNGTPTAIHQDPAPAPPSVSASPTPTESPTPSPSPSTSAEPSGSPSASSKAAPTPTTFRNVTFGLPAGWTMERPDPAYGQVCLFAPDAPASARAKAGICDPYGVLISVWNTATEVENAIWPYESSLDVDGGWGTQPYCPVWDGPHGIGSGDDLRLVGKPERSVAAVGGHYAQTTKWLVQCNARERFTTQIWSFHKEQVLVSTSGLRDDYRDDLLSIVNSLDLSKHADPLNRGESSDIRIGFGAATTSVEGDREVVTFPVTWTNISATAYNAVEPVLTGDPLDGPVDVTKRPDGVLERKDGAGWTSVPAFWQHSDWAYTATSAAFPLAPGKSRTVTFRVRITRQDQMNSHHFSAMAFVSKGIRSLGKAEYELPIHVKTQ